MNIIDEYGDILIYEKFRYLTIPNFIYVAPLFWMIFRYGTNLYSKFYYTA